MTTARDGDPKSGTPADAGRTSAGTFRLSPRNVALLALAVVIAVAVARWLDVYGDRLNEPHCRPAGQDAPAAGCIARMPMSGIDIDASSTVALTPDGATLLAAVETDPATHTHALAGFGVADGKEVWRTSLDQLQAPMISVSPSGGKAAAWDPGAGQDSPVYIVGVPGGTPLGTVTAADIFYDLVFSEDEAAIVVGTAANRRVISLSDPAAQPATAPGFGQARCSGGWVGRSIGNDIFVSNALRSRDNATAVFFLPSGGPASLDSRSTESLMSDICGTRTTAFLSVGDHHEWFASFSPRNNRLAIVYSGSDDRGRRTVIEIWETGDESNRFRFKRVAALPIPGGVGHRIGWSQDEHRLAAVRTDRAGTDALIYWIP